MKQVSNIVFNFEPLDIPIVKGRFALDKLKEDSFPLLVTTAKEGVEIVIRSGLPLFKNYPFQIKNPQFKTYFKEVLELVKKRNITIHATVTNPYMSAVQLFNKLNDEKATMHEDTVLYITMVIYENSIEEMLFKNIVDLVKAFFGQKSESLIPNIEPAFYVEVKSKTDLIELADFLLTNVKKSYGVILLQKYGFYKQGKHSIKDTDAVIASPTEEIYGKIVQINTSTKFLPGEILDMLDNIMVQFGETEYNVDMSNQSLALRGVLKHIESQLLGSAVLCENLYLPSKGELKILRIKKFILKSE